MSGSVTINGSRVISGTLVIPTLGAWHADVVLAETFAPPQTPAGLTLAIGDASFVGTLVRTGNYVGSRGVRLVGGAGGWRAELPPRQYQAGGGVPRSLVLGDLAIECGETVSWDADVTLGPFYVRERAYASRTLAAVSHGQWWVNADGSTRVGVRPSTTITSEFATISFSGAKGKIEIATEEIGDWVPGASFSSPTVTSATIAAVVHTIEETRVRTEILSQ